MTVRRRDDNDTPLSDWIRQHPKLDSIKERLCVIDNDYWIHQYRAHRDRSPSRMIDNLMIVEAKTFMREVKFAQRDTLFLVDQLLRMATVVNGRRRYRMLRGIRPGEVRKVRCFGVHTLRLSGDRPDNSDVILWDHHHIDEATLVEILRYDRDPDHPARMLDLRRHHAPPRSVANLVLFDGTRNEQAREVVQVGPRRSGNEG